MLWPGSGPAGRHEIDRALPVIGLVGAIGWGLLATGALSHVWHQQRLRELLAMHLNHERIPAVVITTAEVMLAVGVAAAFLLESDLLGTVAVAGLLLALGFVGWIGRLLASGSDLPCACSFSAAPTSRWSLLRALCVTLVGAFVLVDVPGSLSSWERIATLAVGWAVAAAIFVLPEAVSWPTASRALLARVDAYDDDTKAVMQ